MTRLVPRAHVGRRHTQPVLVTARYIVEQSATSIVCGVVVGTILTLSVVGPVLYGMGVAL